jgi:hypothetical protein
MRGQRLYLQGRVKRKTELFRKTEKGHVGVD